MVLTNHVNLTFWKHPRKLNDWTARWHAKLQDYDFKIHHVKGRVNLAADALSWADDMDKCKEREPTIVIPSSSFLNSTLLEAGATTIHIRESQQRLLSHKENPQDKQLHKVVIDPDGGLTFRKEGTNKAVIPPDKDLKQYLLEVHYNHPTTGHPGHDETLKELKRYYYWLSMSKWVEQYVQGCAVCQESKIWTHWPKPSLYKILVPEQGRPF